MVIIRVIISWILYVVDQFSRRLGTSEVPVNSFVECDAPFIPQLGALPRLFWICALVLDRLLGALPGIAGLG